MGPSLQAGRDVRVGMADTQSLVGRLASGEVILGDGSYIMTLEKRGYATAGSWTPEAAAEHPEAIEQGSNLPELVQTSPRLSPSGRMTMLFPKAASLRVQKSTKQRATQQRKWLGSGGPLLLGASPKLAPSTWDPQLSPRSRTS